MDNVGFGGFIKMRKYAGKRFDGGMFAHGFDGVAQGGFDARVSCAQEAIPVEFFDCLFCNRHKNHCKYNVFVSGWSRPLPL